MLDKLCKHHNEWLNIAKSFTTTKEDAEDVVQDIYIKLYDKGVEWEDIKYGNQVNKYFMYTLIKNHCFDLLKKRNIKSVIVESEIENLTHLPENEETDQLRHKLEEINKEIMTWDFYDRTLFEIYMYSGLSFRDLSSGSIKPLRRISNKKWLYEPVVRRGTGISVSSMFNTIKKCKEILKQKLS